MLPEYSTQTATNRTPLEDFITDLDMHLNGGTKLKSIKRASGISLSPEGFKRQDTVNGDLRKTFGNPTPVGLLGILLSLTPLSCDLIGWRGAGGNGAASVGAYLFFGGLLLIISGLLEFSLGNTFPFVVFMSFGAFWLSYGITLQPSYNAYTAYAPTNSTSSTAGLATKGFNASFGFLMLFMGVLCLVFLICSLRTNVVYVVVFSTLVVAFGLLTGLHFQLAVGNADLAAGLQVAAGFALLVTSIATWWIFIATMLEALDFPFQIPVGDLSWIIKGANSCLEEDSLA
ncbi:related to Y.lipolytica GPR1 protein and Fun34p [Phialocephala subalpina]|uniref:Related to Y.lipolytica GPR1 protein and Fun34p n=1 Tax=Phialocephala subalpina TaxID=576137 RepID=A0A1L7XRE5_9HELO|nr:related to Y.lipolytica GPR1 protein and Fun34p [Phialocephala subalpina]